MEIPNSSTHWLVYCKAMLLLPTYLQLSSTIPSDKQLEIRNSSWIKEEADNNNLLLSHFENIVSSNSPDCCLSFLGFDELIEICLFVLPFIVFLGAILETVSSKNARLFSFRPFFAAVLIFLPFATSCNTSQGRFSNFFQ